MLFVEASTLTFFPSGTPTPYVKQCKPSVWGYSSGISYIFLQPSLSCRVPAGAQTDELKVVFLSKSWDTWHVIKSRTSFWTRFHSNAVRIKISSLLSLSLMRRQSLCAHFLYVIKPMALESLTDKGKHAISLHHTACIEVAKLVFSQHLRLFITSLSWIFLPFPPPHLSLSGLRSVG